MNFEVLISNLTDPTILFFVLGIIAVVIKSDLAIPNSTSKFIALYLLFAIGFKGGQELAAEPMSADIIYALLFGVVLSAVVPLYTFFILRLKLDNNDAGAVAAAYGSISAVTFIATISFLEAMGVGFSGHMIAVMALMEAPAIIIGVFLMKKFDPSTTATSGMGSIIHHSFTNGSVLMVLGSLLIGLLANSTQAEGIEPFTTDIFKGFLAIFLLEMGMVTARRFATFTKYGLFVTAFAILIPAFNGSVVAFVSQWVTTDVGNRLIFAILAASASYIAVPAAMKLAAPKADPGLYVTMALGITFPFNITIGMPLYYWIVLAS